MSSPPSSRLSSIVVTGLVFLFATAAPARAQNPPPNGATSSSPATGEAGLLLGRVVKAGVGQPGVGVTLHRVTQQSSGAIGQESSASNGEFQFRLPASEGAGFNVFFATVDYLGVRYFGPAVHSGEVPPDYRILIFDTTSALPAGTIRIARRDMILLPETDGSWSGNELIRFVNAGDRTLVSAAGAPTLEFPLPEGAIDVEVTEEEVAATDLSVVGDRAVFTGSLAPGARELFVRYRLPAESPALHLVASSAIDTFSVYVPQEVADVRVAGLGPPQVVTVQDQRFTKYAGFDLAAGHELRVTTSGSSTPLNPVMVGVAVAVFVLGIGTWAAMRGRDPRTAPVGPGRSPAGLSDARGSHPVSGSRLP